MAEKVPGWLERILLPQISEVKGDLKAMSARMEGEFRAVHSEIRRLDEKIDGLDKRTTAKLDELEKRMDVAQRLAVIEGKVHELEARR